MGALDDAIARERSKDEREEAERVAADLRRRRFYRTFSFTENYSDWFQDRPQGPMGDWVRAEQFLLEFRDALSERDGLQSSAFEYEQERIVALAWADHPEPPFHDSDPRIATPELVEEGNEIVANGDPGRLLYIQDFDNSADDMITLWFVRDRGRWFPATPYGRPSIGWFKFATYRYEHVCSRYFIDGPPVAAVRQHYYRGY